MATSPLFSQVNQNKMTLSPLLAVNTIYLQVTHFYYLHLECSALCSRPGTEINAAETIAVSECLSPPTTPEKYVCVFVCIIYIYSFKLGEWLSKVFATKAKDLNSDP